MRILFSVLPVSMEPEYDGAESRYCGAGDSARRTLIVVSLKLSTNGSGIMFVYVDELKLYGSWRYGKSCHLFPTIRKPSGLEALHVFAESIGLRREWFQPGVWPHYDLTASRRKLAVKLGAVELTTREYIKWQRTLSGDASWPDATERIKQIEAAHNARIKEGHDSNLRS